MIRRRPKSWEVVVYAGRDPVTGRERRVSRSVPLPGFVAERLRARRARQAQVALACGVGLGVDAFVLSETPDGSVPLHPNVASDRFRVLTRRLGLQVRLHDLRHATVTLALAAGNAPNDVAAYHGHDSTRMTLDVYGHALPAGLVKIAADLDRLLGQDAQATTRR